MRSYILILLVATSICNVSHCAINPAHHWGEEIKELVHEREKRQLPGGGGDACLQIYSVPKKTVQCEPTNEVRDAIESIRDNLNGHQGLIEGLGERIDDIDPNKEKKLPAEVEQRLATIDEVETTQAGHSEFLRRLESDLGHLITRMEAIESSDRTELARLIELQSQLIQMTMKQSNVSLHDEYVDRLTDSTTDLSSRLQQLELHLTQSLHDTENALEAEVQQTQDEARGSTRELGDRLDAVVTELRERLGTETSSRLRYQNQTTENAGLVEQLDSRLTSIREHQAEFHTTQTNLRATVDTLVKQLAQERVEKEALEHRSDQLQAVVELLEDGWMRMKDELSLCRNNTRDLMDGLSRLSEQASRREHLMPRTLKIGDCQEVLRYYHATSGVYVINPDPTTRPYEVFCDMAGEKEGWTVIQRRQTGELDFFRGWEEYKAGFGDIEEEYWIGLLHLHQLTSRRKYKLRVDLEDWEGRWFHAVYDTFFIEDEDNDYRLHIDGYHGDAGDSLQYHNLMPFSTMDRNNDANSGICATWCRGAWWYKDCFESNLNGRYYQDGPYITKTGWGDGMVWKHIKQTNYYSLKSTIMKITPIYPEAL